MEQRATDGAEGGAKRKRIVRIQGFCGGLTKNDVIKDAHVRRLCAMCWCSQEKPETPREAEQGAAGRAQNEADGMNRTDAEEVSAEDPVAFQRGVESKSSPHQTSPRKPPGRRPSWRLRRRRVCGDAVDSFAAKPQTRFGAALRYN